MMRGFGKRHIKRLAAQLATAQTPNAPSENEAVENNQAENAQAENIFVRDISNENDIKKVDILMANQKVVMRQQAETLAILKQLLHKDVGSFKNRSVFPLNSLEALEALNEEILAGSSESYIKIMQNIIGKTGIVKSIEGIFERSLIVDSNYDGIHSKFALKESKGLMDCLYEALRKDGYCHADFIKDV